MSEARSAPDDGRFAAELRRRLGPDMFGRYFAGRELAIDADDAYVVRASTRFAAGLVERRFSSELREAAAAASDGRIRDVRVEVCARSPDRLGQRQPGEVARMPGALAREREPAPPDERRRPEAEGRRGRPRWSGHRLDGFIVGASNRLAYEAALRVARANEAGLGMLFVYGACGVGKTHLLCGLAGAYQTAHPGARVRYTTGESFTNEFVQAVRAGRVERFRTAYRRADLLCIDDVHFLTNKQATQQELTHTIDALSGGGARVVLASDEAPKRIAKLADTLVSRFMSGLVAEVGVPDVELRERLICANAAGMGLSLDAEAVGAIGAHVAEQSVLGGAGRAGGERALGGSVRDIEGTVMRVAATARLGRDGGGVARVDASLVRRALDERSAGAAIPASSVRIGPDVVIAEVCDMLGVDRSEFAGRGRGRRTVIARCLSAYLCRLMTNASASDIARAMGRPSHSTVLTQCKRFGQMLESDEAAGVGPDLLETPVRRLSDTAQRRVLAVAASRGR